MSKPDLQKLLQQRMSRRQFITFTGVAALSIAGVTKVISELRSQAAALPTAIEPENGTLTNGATVVTDANASGGKALKFGAAPTPTATPVGTRDNLVYGNYVPGPTTTGPLPGTTFTVLGTGPKYKGVAIKSYDDPNCPKKVTSAADWNDGTDHRINVTADGQIIENIELWGSIDIKGHKNVIVRNCILHGDAARVGAAQAFIINSTTYDDLLNITIQDNRMIGRPIRIPNTYNGVALDAAGRIDACNGYNNGMRGSNARMLRNEMVRVPDGIGMTGVPGNWVIMGNWIHRHAYIEWTTHDSTSGPGGWYPTAAGGSMYTHADAIQFHRGKHLRICGNTLGNYLGGAASGDYTHNAAPTQEASILAADDFYNSCFMIKQEVDSSLANQIQDVVIWKNFLGGGVSIINFPSSGNGNPFSKRKVLDNWNDATDPGIGIWHNRVRTDNGSRLGFLIFATWNDRLVDNLNSDGTPVKLTRG